MLFPVDFLRSMGYGGVATVAVDVLAALIVLPALLAVLGHRVNALRIRRSVQRPPRDEASGAWYRLARSVMRRPLVYVTVITIGLLALGSPFLRISWGGTDARTLPAASTVRQVSEALDSQFPVNSTDPIEALITGAGTSAGVTSYLHRSTRSRASRVLASPGPRATWSGWTSAIRRLRCPRPPGTS